MYLELRDFNITEADWVLDGNVLSRIRGRGIGFALLEAAIQKARTLGMNGVYLNAQTHALGFYERAGFVAEGDEFMEAGIPHYRMRQSLT